MLELLVSRSDIRDWAIILYCILGFLLFFFGVLLVAVLIWVALSIKGVVKDLVNDSVKPTLSSFKETAESIKGTADFVGEKAVSPLIKTYGMASGAKRGLGVLSGFARRRGG